MANTGTMTIVATNNGPTADPAAVIKDDLTVGFGAHVTFPATFTVTYAGGASGPATVTPVALTAGFAVNLPVNGAATISLPFTTASVVADGPNTATITTSLPDGDSNLSDNASTITATITPADTCCIAIQNIVVTPNPVPANTAFTVDADFANCGTLPLLAGSATLSNLPTGVTPVGGATVAWPGIPVVGFVHRQWLLNNASTTNQTVNATATANDSCAAGPPVTDVKPIPVSVIGGTPTADLQITKTASAASYVAGDMGSFTITATNLGPDAIPGSRFTDPLANGVLTYGTGLYLITYSGGAAGPDTAISKASLQSPGVIVTTWPVGGTITVVVPFMANAAGTITNTATVNPPSGFVDPPGNNTSSSTVTVTAPPARTVNIDTHKLQVTPGSITAGLNTALHNNYVNNGPDAADGVTVKDAPGPGYNNTWIINQVSGITVSYTGGATGPATLTFAQLLAGFAVPTWPVGGTVDVQYNIYGQQPGMGNRNCATAIAAPGVTLAGSLTTDCFDFSVLGSANCNCGATYSVTPGDVFLGGSFSASYTLPPDGSCCSSVSFKAIQYPSEADASADTNGVFSGQATIACTTMGTSGTFPFTPGQSGFYRFYIDVDTATPAQSCSISDNNIVFGNPPLQGIHLAAISGSWPYHHVI